MHMADAMLSPAVGGTMALVSAAAIGWSAARLRRTAARELAGLESGAYDGGDRIVPMMGVFGAFVFAAQMVNFAIPGTGSSGHLGGGILAAAVLGGPAAMLVMTTVLVIQALCFADGGLLALGCNVFNLGVCTTLIGYPLIFRPMLRLLSGPLPETGIIPSDNHRWRRGVMVASIVSVVVSLQLGSLGVAIETTASGVTELPLIALLAVMQPIHLAIGLVEGIVTAAILTFLIQVRPALPDCVHSLRRDMANSTTEAGMTPGHGGRRAWSPACVLTVLMAVTLLTGSIISLTASAKPDGLEWSIERVAGTEPHHTSPLHRRAAAIVEHTAIMPDYDYAGASPTGDESLGEMPENEPPESAGAVDVANHSAMIPGTSVAGVVGSLFVLLSTLAIGVCITIRRTRTTPDPVRSEQR